MHNEKIKNGNKKQDFPVFCCRLAVNLFDYLPIVSAFFPYFFISFIMSVFFSSFFISFIISVFAGAEAAGAAAICWPAIALKLRVEAKIVAISADISLFIYFSLKGTVI